MKRSFDQQALVSEYDKLMWKVKSGKRLAPFERSFGATLGHAVDALEFSNDMGAPLDLNRIDEESILKVITAMSIAFRKTTASQKKCLETVEKKIGSYMLFAINNILNKEDGSSSAKPVLSNGHICIEANNNGTDPVVIDVLTAAATFINENVSVDNSTGAVMIEHPEELLKDIAFEI